MKKYLIILSLLFLCVPLYADGMGRGDGLGDKGMEIKEADGSPDQYAGEIETFVYPNGTLTYIAGTMTLSLSGYADNAFKTLSVSGQSDVVADSATDTLTLVGAGITAITTNATTDTITFTSTEVDGSTTNEIQNLWATISSQSGNTTANSSTDTLTINGAGIASTAIAGDTLTITATEVDGSTTNEINTIQGDDDVATSGLAISIDGAGIVTTDVVGDTLTITGTEVDGSTTNEINTITCPDANVTAGLGITFAQSGIMAITESAADTITFTANEAQTLDAVCLLGSSTTTDIDLTGTGPDITFTPTGGDAMGIHAESDIFIIKNETDNVQWMRIEGSQDIFLAPDSGNVSIAGGLGFPNKKLYVNGTTQITGATQLDSTLDVTGAVTGSNLSGTNTGDQTITLTGDVTGSGTGSFATSLATDSVSDNEIDYTNVNMDDMTDGATNAAITLTQETNFTTAYTHSQDNTQAHSDYLLNSAADTMTGNLTITATDPAIILDESAATDTDFWIANISDSAGDDDDTLQIGDGTTVGTNPFLTINTSGSVGIGTTNPTEKLYVDSGSDGNIAVFDASSGSFGEIQIMDADMSVPGRLRYDAGEFQLFVGNSLQAVTVQSLGNVGIGTTAPGYKLDVNGDIGVSSILYDRTNTTNFLDFDDDSMVTNSVTGASASDFNIIIDSNNNGTTAAFKVMKDALTENTATELFRVQENGNVGIGTTAPVQALDFGAAKKNIKFSTYTHIGEAGSSLATLIGNNLRVSTSVNDQIEVSGNGTDAAHGIHMVYNKGWSFMSLAQNHGNAAGTAINVDSNTKVRIKTDGNVGIGTTGPLAKLEVANGATSAGVIAIREDSDDGTNNVTFTVPALAADVDYTLPNALGGAGTQLTDAAGNGTLSWAAAGGSAETLAATLAVGADANDVDITSLGKLEFFDVGLYLDADADGVMDITSDGTLELHSADWDISTTGAITNCSLAAADNVIEADTVVVADTEDATTFVGLWTDATGSLLPKTDETLTYVANTGILTATGFVGDITGDASGSSGSCTGNSATVTVDATTTDTTSFVGLFESASGSLEPQTDATLIYNATTGSLGATDLLINGATVGTSGVGVIAIKNGTIPTSSPADETQLYSEDVAQGYGNTGGTITTDGNYTVHTFLSSDDFTCIGSANVATLVVAGGGGGGGYISGGGGGAGGFIYDASFAVTPQVYPITVGAGGAGALKDSNAQGSDGNNSVFSSNTATAGGGGGHKDTSSGAGRDGGSGGGGASTVSGVGGTGSQGNNGGAGTANLGNSSSSGGGGGAGAVGADGASGAGGNGGAGTASTIYDGSSITYAGGGGGGVYTGTGGTGGAGGGGDGSDSAGTPTSGTANTGGGGGADGGNIYGAGSGGSGIVIIRCLTADFPIISSELKVRDEIGTVTTLSPHNFKNIPHEVVEQAKKDSNDLAWTYHSEKNGKEITVDMFNAIKDLEAVTGKKYIYTDIPTPVIIQNSPRYFVEIKDNIVQRVIVADKEWCEQKLGGEWGETFIDNPQKNYASKGYIYYPDKDNFSPPKPYPSWTLDDKCKWKAPKEMPKDGKIYTWNETKLTWEEAK